MITLATLPEATSQEVFNQAVRHLHNQNTKCELDTNCVYNDGFGKKCAAGCFISDDEYDDEYEFLNWSAVVESDNVPDNHFELIESLQIVHDRSPIRLWKKDLKKLAASEGLKYPSNCEDWEGQE
jgi:hypothetical protein